MKLLSIEPTPSPNSMKLNVDEKLPGGVHEEYTQKNKDQAPEYVQKLLAIPGVKEVFRVADFIALERVATASWQTILAQAGEILGGAVTGEAVNGGQAPSQPEAAFGEAKVFIQMFRTLPMQVKVTTETEQIRAALPERFTKAAMQAGAASPNLVMERRWVEQGVRYGELKEIGEEVAQEIDAAYDQARLEALMQEILQDVGEQAPAPARTVTITAEMFDDPDWRKRYAALEQLEPTEETLPLVVKALTDEKSSIRRLATVYLGIIGGEIVLPYLYQALQDESVPVRRTAGDTLSDIGDPQAIGPMLNALKDRNKLVRWRAARFLYEVGDETALAGLKEAEDDPEFEVSMQIKMAIERIERGEAASGSVWQQMTNRER